MTVHTEPYNRTATCVALIQILLHLLFIIISWTKTKM